MKLLYHSKKKSSFDLYEINFFYDKKRLTIYIYIYNEYARLV